MSIGHQFRQGFEMILQQMGGTVIVYKNWGTPDETSFQVRGLKNNEKNRPSKVMFQFAERIDAQPGDVLQQKGATDLWRVVDVEDTIETDVFVLFEAKVEKLTARRGDWNRASQVFVNGPNYGGIQVAGSHSTQAMSVEAARIDENLGKLRALVNKLSLNELDQEEVSLAIDRLSQLARKPRSEEVIAKAKERLDLVKSIFEVSKDFAALAAPSIGVVSQFFAGR